jgi:nitrite reductase/ring-hydroxylating ferredoxin subunit
MSGFERLVSLDELQPCHTRVLDHRGQKVMLVRLGDEVRVYDARCPHARTVIPETRLGDDLLIECPMHGARFSAEDGARHDGPSCADMTAWPVRIVDGYVEAAVPERVVANDRRPASWGPVGRASEAP